MEKILLCKLKKRIKVVQITPNRNWFVFDSILKISADLFGNLAVTLSAQFSVKSVKEFRLWLGYGQRRGWGGKERRGKAQ
jgi:hypothetical protein